MTCYEYLGSLWLRFALLKSSRAMSRKSGCLCSALIMWPARFVTAHDTGLRQDVNNGQSKQGKLIFPASSTMLFALKSLEVFVGPCSGPDSISTCGPLLCVIPLLSASFPAILELSYDKSGNIVSIHGHQVGYLSFIIYINFCKYTF